MKNYYSGLLSLLTFILLFVTLTVDAQSPQGIKYQAVARDASGEVMSNESITVRLGIYSGSQATTKVYEETQNITTNQYGLFSLTIGEGSSIFGTFSNIDWGNDDHHLKVEVNTGGGFVDMGTNPLESVPYSLYAEEAGAVSGMSIGQLTDVQISGISNGQVLKWDGSTLVPGQDEGLTSVQTDATLQGSGIMGDELGLASQSADNGDVLKWDGSAWVPGTDQSGGSFMAGTGIDITGNTISNTAPDQIVSLMGSGSTTVSGTYPNFTISSTDNNTTYTAGVGLNLNGTQFNAMNTNAIWNANTLQGNDVATMTPSDGEVLQWNASSSSWEPNSFSAGLWSENSGDLYYNGGSVGIGTSTPEADLEVSQSESSIVRVNAGNTGDTSSLDFVNGDMGGIFSAFDIKAVSEDRLTFGYRSEGAFPTVEDILVLNKEGEIGIGNADPSEELDLQGTFELAEGSEAFDIDVNADGQLEFRANTTDLSMVLDDESPFAIGLGTYPTDYNIEMAGDSIQFDIEQAIEEFKMTSRNFGFNDPALLPTGSEFGVIGTEDLPLYRVYSSEFYAETSGDYLAYSDRRIKENITALKEPVEKLKQINGVFYDIEESHYQRTSSDRDGDDRKNNIGLIAQEVEKVYPQLVKTDRDGLKSVGYMGLIPVLVEATKQMNATIESQQNTIEKQQQKIDDLQERMLKLEERMDQLEKDQ